MEMADMVIAGVTLIGVAVLTIDAFTDFLKGGTAETVILAVTGGGAAYLSVRAF